MEGLNMTMLVREAMENGLAIELFDGNKGTIELKHEGKWIKAKKDIDNNINGYMYDFQYNSMRSKK